MVQNKKVLVVDDDETIRSSLATLLASDTVVVRTASIKKEAQYLLDTETFDLVITDLHLTGRGSMEGLDLISEITARTPQTPVVLFTAYGSPEIEQESRKRGGVDYWEKTISIPIMVERLRTLGIPAGHKEGSPETTFTTDTHR